MRGLRALFCVSVLTLGSASAARAQEAPSATAPDRDQARRLFQEGAALERKSEFAAALGKYAEARQLAVTPGLRFHEGYCLEMLGKLAGALEAYEAADTLAREQSRKDVRAAILVRLQPLRRRVPQLAIRVAPHAHEAAVQLDGVPLAQLHLDGTPFRVDPGDHTVTAHAAGYSDVVRKVQAPEGVTTSVDLSFERAAPIAASPRAAAPPVPAAPQPASAAPGDRPGGGVTEPPSKSPRGRSRALPIASTAGAVVLAGAGVAFFLVAGGVQSDAERDCLTRTSCTGERARIRTFDALALGSFVGAAGLGVVSALLWTSKAPDRTAAGPRLSPPHVRLLATPTTLGLEGTL